MRRTLLCKVKKQLMMNDLSHLSKLSKLMQNIERRRTLQTLLYSGFFSKINCNLFLMEQTKFEQSERSESLVTTSEASQIIFYLVFESNEIRKKKINDLTPRRFAPQLQLMDLELWKVCLFEKVCDIVRDSFWIIIVD